MPLVVYFETLPYSDNLRSPVWTGWGLSLNTQRVRSLHSIINPHERNDVDYQSTRRWKLLHAREHT